MSQDKKNTSNNKNIKTPKFNFYWIYGGIFVLFIVYQFFNSENLTSKNLSQNEFKEILIENDIDKILIVNRDIANIYIKNEALTRKNIQRIKVPYILVIQQCIIMILVIYKTSKKN